MGSRGPGHSAVRSSPKPDHGLGVRTFYGDPHRQWSVCPIREHVTPVLYHRDMSHSRMLPLPPDLTAIQRADLDRRLVPGVSATGSSLSYGGGSVLLHAFSAHALDLAVAVVRAEIALVVAPVPCWRSHGFGGAGRAAT